MIFKNETVYENRNRKTYFNDIYENIVNKVIGRRKPLTIRDYKEAPYYVEVSHLSADKDKSNCMGWLQHLFTKASLSAIFRIYIQFFLVQNNNVIVLYHL